MVYILLKSFIQLDLTINLISYLINQLNARIRSQKVHNKGSMFNIDNNHEFMDAISVGVAR